MTAALWEEARDSGVSHERPDFGSVNDFIASMLPRDHIMTVLHGTFLGRGKIMQLTEYFLILADETTNLLIIRRIPFS